MQKFKFKFNYLNYFDYKDFVILQNYIKFSGKIIPKRLNKLTTKKQRYVSKAIKNARLLSFLPFLLGHSKKK